MAIAAPANSHQSRVPSRIVRWEWWAFVYLRMALGVAFLSGIADRFGLYRGRNVGYGNFQGFLQYTAKVNSFMPCLNDPLPGVGGDDRGIRIRSRPGDRAMGTLGGPG